MVWNCPWLESAVFKLHWCVCQDSDKQGEEPSVFRENNASLMLHKFVGRKSIKLSTLA